jgi:hypothetical protein
MTGQDAVFTGGAKFLVTQGSSTGPDSIGKTTVISAYSNNIIVTLSQTDYVPRDSRNAGLDSLIELHKEIQDLFLSTLQIH